MNRLEQKKLEVNQRYALRQWLANADDDFFKQLALLDFEAGCLISDHFVNWPCPEEGQAGYYDFDCWDALQAWCQSLVFSAKPGRLFLGNQLPCLFTSTQLWQTYQSELLACYQQRPVSMIALVADDLSQGIVIDEYLGYLPDERRSNDHEVVYQVATWGDGAPFLKLV